MKRYTENGVNSKSFINALAKAKRDANKEKYSFEENVENVKYTYYLTDEETKELRSKLLTYCRENYLYVRYVFSIEE